MYIYRIIMIHLPVDLMLIWQRYSGSINSTFKNGIEFLRNLERRLDEASGRNLCHMNWLSHMLGLGLCRFTSIIFNFHCYFCIYSDEPYITSLSSFREWPPPNLVLSDRIWKVWYFSVEKIRRFAFNEVNRGEISVTHLLTRDSRKYSNAEYRFQELSAA